MIATEMLSRIQQAGEAGADSWSLFNLTETGSHIRVYSESSNVEP